MCENPSQDRIFLNARRRLQNDISTKQLTHQQKSKAYDMPRLFFFNYSKDLTNAVFFQPS